MAADLLQVVRITAKGTSGTAFSVELSDGSFFCVGADFLLQNHLAKGVPVEEALRLRLQAEEECRAVREKALALLARRDHASTELALKLRQRKFPEAAIDAVIGSLADNGTLNDERFARLRAAARVQAKNWGRRKITSELMGLGVAADAVQRAVADAVTPEAEAAALERALRKQLRLRGRETPAECCEAEFGRIVGALQRLGFDYADIRERLKEPAADAGNEPQ